MNDEFDSTAAAAATAELRGRMYARPENEPEPVFVAPLLVSEGKGERPVAAISKEEFDKLARYVQRLKSALDTANGNIAALRRAMDDMSRELERKVDHRW